MPMPMPCHAMPCHAHAHVDGLLSDQLEMLSNIQALHWPFSQCD